MDEQIGSDSEIMGKLFALVTARLEDAGEIALSGHVADNALRRELASQLIDISGEVRLISESMLLILQDELGDNVET